jgi:hypothetical protein
MPIRSFEDHLANLYEHYKWELDGIPTADQILSGVASKPLREVEVETHIALANNLLRELRKTYTGKFNVLVEAKVNRLIDWVLDVQPSEIAILTIAMLDDLFTQAYRERLARKEELAVYWGLLDAQM